jgi:hypothetical protein
MVKANQRLRETPTFEGDPRTIPAPIGSTPIPEGNVRFNHYTRPENVESIRQHGLLQSRNRNSVAADAGESVVFAHAGVPRPQDMRSAVFVEGYANAHTFSHGGQLGIGAWGGEHYGGEGLSGHIKHMEERGSVITALGDIPPSQIIGIHQPWHDAYRYFEKEKSRKGVTEGEYEHVADMDDYGPALKAHKIVNAATVMLGGKL